ncbi:MAG: hypothetical protein LBT47_01200 [Deltaproteobacteria bacterium]|jgi:hypothetical protein|nr:hypothetical protein [Deltaproteobacteria bacterium]
MTRLVRNFFKENPIGSLMFLANGLDLKNWYVRQAIYRTLELGDLVIVGDRYDYRTVGNRQRRRFNQPLVFTNSLTLLRLAGTLPAIGGQK